MSKLQDKPSKTTTTVVAERLGMLPSKARRTITLDNGPENQDWQALQAATGIRCFFSHAYHSWERRTNENTNGLIRDYFPKKTDFTTIPEAELAFVEYELNTRPRKRLGWLTPLEAFSKELNQFSMILKVPSVALGG